MLETSIELTLHTNDANMLFTGKWSTKNNASFVPSFYYSAARLNRILGMAQKQNPYAEAALIDIDYQLDEIAELIKSIKIVSRRCIKRAQKKGIKTNLIKRRDPYVKSVTYATEYTLCIARMIASADEAIRYLRTANLSRELSTQATSNYITALRRKTRTIFNTIVGYAGRIIPGLKREDIEQKTAQAQTMIKNLGMPSAQIMNREITYRETRVMDLALD